MADMDTGRADCGMDSYPDLPIGDDMKTFAEYQIGASRTAKHQDMTFDLTHAALGLAGEAGEFADCIKKYTVYNKPLDRANAVEELGDILWFMALACDALDVDMQEVAQMNIDKLRLRYPEYYTDRLATERRDKVCDND